MADIIHRIGIKAPAAKVYAALSTIDGLAGWWTKDTTGSSKTGGEITFTFRTPKGDVLGEMLMNVKALDPSKRVAWTVKNGPPEWIGTNIAFDLSEADGMTIVIFGHRGWTKVEEFMSHCSMKWAVFLLSLRDLVEKGQGQPSPGDVKIDNWN